MVKPKYYHYDKLWKRYRVIKNIDKKNISYGTYATEKEAQKVVSYLIECNWDKTQLPGILKKLGITSKIKKEE